MIQQSHMSTVQQQAPREEGGAVVCITAKGSRGRLKYHQFETGCSESTEALLAPAELQSVSRSQVCLQMQ